MEEYEKKILMEMTLTLRVDKVKLYKTGTAKYPVLFL